MQSLMSFLIQRVALGRSVSTDVCLCGYIQGVERPKRQRIFAIRNLNNKGHRETVCGNYFRVGTKSGPERTETCKTSILHNLRFSFTWTFSQSGE